MRLSWPGQLFGLQWLDCRYAMQVFSTEIYIVLIAASFTALGVRARYHLTRESTPEEFIRNTAALASLGVSPNTVKTHVSRLYDKLDVQRRTQAIHKAKALVLIP